MKMLHWEMLWLCVIVLASTAHGESLTENTIDNEFSSFKEKFGRSYSSPAEEMRRRSVFRDNLIELRNRNRYGEGVTKFTDWTMKEKRQLMGDIEVPLFGSARVDSAGSLGSVQGTPSCKADVAGVSLGNNAIDHAGQCGPVSDATFFTPLYGVDGIKSLDSDGKFDVYVVNQANYNLYLASQSFSYIGQGGDLDGGDSWNWVAEYKAFQNYNKPGDTFHVLVRCRRTGGCTFNYGFVMEFEGNPIDACNFRETEVTCDQLANCHWSSATAMCEKDPIGDHDGTAPAAFDWRDYGIIGPVHTQSTCGSCWAFAAAENAESMWKLAGHQLLDLSEQYLVDCDVSTSSGCDGGYSADAINFIKSSGGIELESCYPYENMDSGGCRSHASSCKKLTDPVLRGVDFATTTELALKTRVYNLGPVVVSVNADDMTSYTGGIFNCGVHNTTNHAVQIVGYGSQGSDYWIVKNSWGADWGENGYMRMLRGVGACYLRSYSSLLSVCSPAGCNGRGTCDYMDGPMEPNKYVQCNCSTGFWGSVCENLCECEHDSRCDRLDGCNCTGLVYGGPKCAECQCKNGGSCLNETTCSCPEGTEPPFCETPQDSRSNILIVPLSLVFTVVSLVFVAW